MCHDNLDQALEYRDVQNKTFEMQLQSLTQTTKDKSRISEEVYVQFWMELDY